MLSLSEILLMTKITTGRTILAVIKGKFAKTYDRFLRRESLLPPGLLELVRSTGARNILDLGAGTGTIAVGLAAEGYDAIGVDFSSDMLKKARQKARLHKTGARFFYGNIIYVDLEMSFDMVLCLGNTLPLIQNIADSRRLFKNCHRHLKPGGWLIFQILNYDRILKFRPATFATDVLDDLIRIKQYRYEKDTIDFVVSLIETAKIPPKISFSRRKIKPWIAKNLKFELRRAGFKKISAFGDYSKSKFTLESKDLIILCRR